MIVIFSDSKEMSASQETFLNVTLTNYWSKHVNLVKIMSLTEITEWQRKSEGERQVKEDKEGPS